MIEEAIKMTANRRVEAPFRISELEAFINSVPAEALVKIVTITEGQRDPADKAYIFSAKWEVSNA